MQSMFYHLIASASKGNPLFIERKLLIAAGKIMVHSSFYISCQPAREAINIEIKQRDIKARSP